MPLETGNHAWETVETAPDGHRRVRSGVLVITRQAGGMMVWEWSGVAIYPAVNAMVLPEHRTEQ